MNYTNTQVYINRLDLNFKEFLCSIINRISLNEKKGEFIFFFDPKIKNILTNNSINDFSFIDEKNDIYIFTLELKEKDKNLKTIEEVYSIFLEKNIDKDDFVVAIGGGVFSDIIGFASTTYKRGICFAFVPTTFLSMIDACFGGKNGVNFQEVKNIIGTINQPEYIFIFPEFLNYLSKVDFLSGLAEFVKYLLINIRLYRKFIRFFSKYFIKLSNQNSTAIKNKSNNSCYLNHDLIKSFFVENPIFLLNSLETKYKYIKNDIFDRKIRHILNLGHTISHGLELTFNLRHGIALLSGLILELKASSQIFPNTGFTLKKAYKLFQLLNLPFKLDEIFKLEKNIRLKDFLIKNNLSIESIIDKLIKTIHQDKKNTGNFYNVPVILNNNKIKIYKIDFNRFDNVLSNLLFDEFNYN